MGYHLYYIILLELCARLRVPTHSVTIIKVDRDNLTIKNIEKMKFTKLQLAAISRLALLMEKADGEFKDCESKVFVNWMTKLSLDSGLTNYDEVAAFAKSMEVADVVPVILPMTTEQKTRVAAFIGTIMLADGVIDSNEKRVFDTVCKLCGLPTLTYSQCREIFA